MGHILLSWLLWLAMLLLLLLMMMLLLLCPRCEPHTVNVVVAADAVINMHNITPSVAILAHACYLVALAMKRRGEPHHIQEDQVEQCHARSHS